MLRNPELICPILLFLLCATPFVTVAHSTSGEQSNIYIKATGEVDPVTAPIQRVGDTLYVLTGDVVNQSVVVERSGITIDGMWHRLTGKGALDPNATGGFKLDRVSNVTIKRAKITQSFSGMYLSQCGNCVMQENQLFNNSYGVYVLASSNGTLIERNRIFDNFGQGIYVANSFNLTVKSNIVTGSFPFGVRLTGSHNCTLTENTFYGNEGGVHLYDSYNISIYHNDILDNLMSAKTTSSTGIWDDGTHGNFWSDYDGIDADHDGIGDTPYTIDTNNVDRYPLVHPLRLGLCGDVNYDGIVDISDLTLLGSVYNKKEGESGWVPQADLAKPYGVINILDVVTCVAHYKETYP